MHTPPRLAVAWHQSHAARASQLAEQLQLDLCQPGTQRQAGQDGLAACEDYDFFLAFRDNQQQPQLILYCPAGDLGSPFFIDFAHGQLAHRRQFGGGRGQPLARAIGLKGGNNPTVVDATAGMGRDAFVLASLGAGLTLLERSPILAALLADALQRAQHDAALDPAIAARMRLVQTNAIGWLQECEEDARPEVVYLDPMYPHRSKSALVKKEMRILRALVGDDDDAGALLAAALRCAKKRVVVKRPKTAAPVIIDDNQKLRPAAAVASKNTRYDIYPVG